MWGYRGKWAIALVAALSVLCLWNWPGAANAAEEEAYDIVIHSRDEQTVKGWGVFPAWNRSDWGRNFIDKTGAQEALYNDLGVNMFRIMIPASAGDGNGNLVTARMQEMGNLIRTAYNHEVYDYMISVWSPPVGMKTHPTVNGWTGSEHVRLLPEKEDAYAGYLVRVIQWLVADGVGAPKALSFQNEPLSQIVSEWCYWGGDNGQQFQRFTKLLRQKLDLAGLSDVLIIAPEGAAYHDNEKLLGANFEAVAQDSELEAAIGGFASHSYVSREFSSKQTIEGYKNAADRFPDKDRWQTEYSSLISGVSQQDMAIDVAQRLISDMAYIRNNYWFWWLGWDHQRTVGYVGEVILEGDGYTVDKSKAFHFLSKVFHEVPAGSKMRRISADPASGLVTADELWMDGVAFDDNGRTVALLINPHDEDRRVNIGGLSGASARIYQMTEHTTEVDGMVRTAVRNIVSGGVDDLVLPARSITVLAANAQDEAPPYIRFDQKDSSSVLDAVYAVRQPSFTVTGRLDEPGVLLVNGLPVLVEQDLTFAAVVTLAAGGNVITAQATDANGNASSPAALFLRHDPAYLGVSLPQAGYSYTNNPVFTVRGEVNDSAEITLLHTYQGMETVTATVQATLAPGTLLAPFAAEITLLEGENVLRATARNGYDEQSEPAVITVVYDSAAPAINSPLTDTAYAGSYVLRGALSEEAVLRVNGVIQRVEADLSFAVIVPVEEGLNTIVLTAEDRAGNLSVRQIEVAAAVQQDDALAPGLIQSKRIASQDIIIDGNLNEAHWQLNHQARKLLAGRSDNDVAFSTAWNEEYLYVGIRVIDVHKVNDSSRGYEDDSVEIYIDGNNGRTGTYGSDDHQITLGWQDAELSVGRNITGLQYAQQDDPDGYTVEFAIPWNGIGIDPPKTGTVIGFDIGNNDDDGTNNGYRQGQLMWHGNLDNWSNTSAFGSLLLSDGNAAAIAPSARAPIVINGIFDEPAWTIGQTVHQVMAGSPQGALSFGALSDKDHLYIALQVEASGMELADEDILELFLEPDVLNRGSGEAAAYRLELDWAAGTAVGDLDVVHFGRTVRENGYSIELAIPWSELGAAASRHLTLGLEIVYTRTDSSGTAVLAWSGAADPVSSTDGYGYLLLHNFDLPTREYVVQEPPGLRVFHDPARDLSRIAEMSSNIIVVSWDPHKFNGDADRLGHRNDNPATPEYVVYESPYGDIFSFEILTGQFDNTPGFKFFVSADGVSYTQINADFKLVGGQYSYSVRERTSHRLGAGMRYLKVEFPGTLNWHANILDIKFKYAGDPSLQDFEDTAADFSKLHRYSSGIRIATYEPQKFGGDANRFKHATDNPAEIQYVEYASPDGEILEFEVITALYQGNSPFRFYGSADGTDYEQIAVNRTLVTSGSGYAVHANIPSEALEEGTRYLRIQFPGAANWHEYVNHVKFTYRVTDTEPEEPELLFTDNGSDLSKLYAHSPAIVVANYQPEKFGGDADRFKHTSNNPVAPEFVEYESPGGAITSFQVDTARYQGTPAFVFWGSSDGITYGELAYSSTLLSSGQGYAVQRHAPSQALPPNIRYLKVQFPGGLNWHEYINQISFSYKSGVLD
ncbi:MAG: hypothetical protein K0R57_5947 [Paenibacillaceae bacterium]|jgi:O-glycosyl hydrolase|nr:hypothetical protein [Paenibacillaceae bacterium]